MKFVKHLNYFYQYKLNTFFDGTHLEISNYNFHFTFFYLTQRILKTNYVYTIQQITGLNRNIIWAFEMPIGLHDSIQNPSVTMQKF